MKLAEIAEKISKHLKRFEGSKKHNPPDPKYKLRPYYCASAFVYGARVYVSYISYQGRSGLKKVDALKYLAWLDAGNVGRHHECPTIDRKNVSFKSR